tara:strand:- start:443 stop:868 length:426 start_codon:yes stop_codon:yes gene_type:complete
MSWIGTKGCKKKDLLSISWLREIKWKKYPFWRLDTYFSKTKHINLDIIDDGGWHFTNLKSPEDMYDKFMNFGHHNEFRMSGLTINDIKNKIKNRELFYNHFKDTTSKNKWESNHKLKKTDLSLLPKFLRENSNKYKEWFDA